MGNFSLPKKFRLRKNNEFRAVLSCKCLAKNDLILLYSKKNGLEHPRFGVSVGKKFGNAVRRNRLKRVAKEAFRLSQHDLPTGYDYLLIYTAKLTKNNNMDVVNMEIVRNSLLELAGDKKNAKDC